MASSVEAISSGGRVIDVVIGAVIAASAIVHALFGLSSEDTGIQLITGGLAATMGGIATIVFLSPNDMSLSLKAKYASAVVAVFGIAIFASGVLIWAIP